MSELYIGLISGTSIDGIDAALVDLSKEQPKLLANHSHPIPANITTQIRALCTPSTNANEIDQLGELDGELGKQFADACMALLDKANTPATKITAIGSHGQTVRHRPEAANPFTLQIADPNIIAEQTGITTIADFRRRDMACGGQGAPFAPAFHQAIAPANIKCCAFLNLGGIANITVLNNGKLAGGYDTGPANGLMDTWIQQHRNLPFDNNGEWAASGTVNNALLETLLADIYFSQPAPKSTGREYFHLDWLHNHAPHIATLPSNDVQATLMALSAQSISHQLAIHSPTVVYCCGGGVHNRALIAQLQALNPNADITDTHSLGIAPDWIEAAAFAWLAKKHMNGEAVDLTQVTGARKPCLLGAKFA